MAPDLASNPPEGVHALYAMRHGDDAEAKALLDCSAVLPIGEVVGIARVHVFEAHRAPVDLEVVVRNPALAAQAEVSVRHQGTLCSLAGDDHAVAGAVRLAVPIERHIAAAAGELEGDQEISGGELVV